MLRVDSLGFYSCTLTLISEQIFQFISCELVALGWAEGTACYSIVRPQHSVWLTRQLTGPSFDKKYLAIFIVCT